MPQNRPSAVEIYERKRKPSAVELFERRQQPPQPQALAPGPVAAQPPPEVGFLENVKIGAQQGYQDYIEAPIYALAEAGQSAVKGDFTPARQLAEQYGRGALKFASAFDPAGAAYEPTAAEQDPRIAAVQSEQDRRRASNPAFRDQNIERAKLNERAALDPSLSGRVTRGVASGAVGAVPAIAAGIVSGGSVPAIAATTALQSAAQPENAALNVGMSAIPLPVGKFVAPILRRIRGGTAAAETATARTVAETVPFEAVPNAPTTNPLPRAILQNAETAAPVLAVDPLMEQAKRELVSVGIDLASDRSGLSILQRRLKIGYAQAERLRGQIRAEALAAEGAVPAAAAPVTRTTAPVNAPQVQPTTDPLTQAVERINASNLSPEQKTALLDPLIQAVRQRAGGASTATESMVQSGWPRSTQAQPMVMPGNPNAVQQAGVLPRTFEGTAAPAAPVAPQVAAPASEQIVERMAALQRTPSSPVEIGELRKRFPGMSKEAFDAEMVKLANEGQTFLHRHDYAASLSEAERGALVREAKRTALSSGEDPYNYFVAATFPNGPPAIRAVGQAAEQAAAVRAPSASPAMEMNPQYSAELESPTFGVRKAPSAPYTESVGPRLEEVGYSAPSPKASADPSLVTKAERTPILETISAFRKAGLLTGIKTHLKNVGGTGLFQVSEEAARIPGAIADMLVSGFTKRRTLTGPSASAMARSFGEAATKGVREAKEIIKRGISDTDLERLGINQEINSGSKVLDTYINSTFRLLSAEDKVMRTYALRRALEDRARAAVLTEIRQGQIPRGDFGSRVKEILAAPPEDLAAAAATDAEIAVFNNPNLVSDARTAVRDTLSKSKAGRVADFGIDQVVPFVKTPTNVIARMLDYAGVTSGPRAAHLAAKAIVKRSMSEADQRAFAQSFGRASIGAGLIALGAKGYQDGWLTGLIEDDLSRRARDEAAGRTPGSVKVGDTWHQIIGAAPLGSLLAIGATLAREVEQEREGSGLGPAIEVAGQAIGEQPLLIGSKQIGEALTKPGSVGERLLGGALGSFVPTMVSDVAEAVDPTQREGRGITGAAQKRIPGARNFLPEAQDALGQPNQDSGPAQAFLDPTRATTDVAASNPLLRELVRLDQGISGFRKQEDESDDAYRTKVQSFGRIYSKFGAQLLDFRPYKAASPDLQKEALKRLNDRAKDTVRDAKERQAPASLNPAVVMAAARRALAERAKKKK